jgi:DNA-binding NarL/FixJ family response regulator
MRLKLERDITVVGEAGDGLAALAQASVLRPDVILADVESARMDGVRLIDALRATSPGSAIVVLSLRDDPLTRKQAHAAGAAAFVSKHGPGDELICAIRRAAAGEQEPLFSRMGSKHTGNALT